MINADPCSAILPLLTGELAQPHPSVLRRLDRRGLDRLHQRTVEELGIEVVVDRHRQAQRLEHRNVDVVPLADVSEKSLAAAAGELGVKTTYASYEQMKACHQASDNGHHQHDGIRADAVPHHRKHFAKLEGRPKLAGVGVAGDGRWQRLS